MMKGKQTDVWSDMLRYMYLFPINAYVGYVV